MLSFLWWQSCELVPCARIVRQKQKKMSKFHVIFSTFGKSFRIELSILDMCRNRSLNTQNIPTISNISHKHPSDTAHTYDSLFRCRQFKLRYFHGEIYLKYFLPCLFQFCRWTLSEAEINLFSISRTQFRPSITHKHTTHEDPKKVESWIPFSLFACFFLCALTHPKSSSCKVDAHFYRVHMLQSSLSTLSPRMVGVKLME